MYWPACCRSLQRVEGCVLVRRAMCVSYSATCPAASTLDFSALRTHQNPLITRLLSDVVIVQGELSEVTLTTEGSLNSLARRYEVRKMNKWGVVQHRIIVLDSTSFMLRSYESELVKHSAQAFTGDLTGKRRPGKLRRALPLSKLLHIERSFVDMRNLKLMFAEEEEALYDLVFDSPDEVQLFSSEVLAACEQMQAQQKRVAPHASAGSSPASSHDAAAVAILSKQVRELMDAQKDVLNHLQVRN